MSHRRVGIASPKPQPAADDPTARKAWVEDQCPVHQLDGRVNCLPEVSEDVCGGGKNERIVIRSLESGAGCRNTFSLGPRHILGPAIDMEVLLAERNEDEGRTVSWIPGDRPIEKRQRRFDALLLPSEGL